MKKLSRHSRTMWIAAAIITAVPLPASAQQESVKKKAAKRGAVNVKATPAQAAINATGDLLYFGGSSGVYGSVVLDKSLSAGNILGITVAPTDPVLRAQLNLKKSKGGYGVVVTRVLTKSPAAKAQVRAHDIILSATGAELAEGTDLSTVIRKAGKKALYLKVLRGGKVLSVTIKPEPAKRVTGWQPGVMQMAIGSNYKYKIGVNTNPASRELIAQLVLPPSTGRVITHVEPKSPAQAAGLQKYDVILKVGDAYVKTRSDLSKAVDKLKGKPVSIEFLRAGRKQTCTVKPAKRTNDGTYLLWTTRGPQIGTMGGFTAMRGFDYTIWPRKPTGGVQFRNYGTVESVDHPATVRSQVDAMAKQLKTLQNSLDRLKATLAKSKKTKTSKRPAAKKRPAKK